jgi:hypothetical protein
MPEFVLSDGPQIWVAVPMNVTRIRTIDNNELVQVWGLVGDYEICTYLREDDGRVKAIMKEVKKRHAKAARRPSDG